MPKSLRMKWPYPAENADPWYKKFEDLIIALDASGFAAREDRHIILMEGGTVSFTASSGNVTWSAPIQILGGITGFTWSLAAQTVTLQDQQVLYVDLVRGLTSAVALTPGIASKVPNTDDGLFLAYRLGSRVYWRDGKVLQDGDSVELFQTSGGGGGGSGVVTSLGVASTQAVTDTAPQVLGNYELDASAYSTVQLLTMGHVSGGAVTGTVELYNLTDSASAYIETFTGVTAPTRRISGTLSLPAAAKMYEVRGRLTAGSPSVDFLFAQWVGFELT
jgi:hypothetical protein